jgi:hypothetical protein
MIKGAAAKTYSFFNANNGITYVNVSAYCVGISQFFKSNNAEGLSLCHLQQLIPLLNSNVTFSSPSFTN